MTNLDQILAVTSAATEGPWLNKESAQGRAWRIFTKNGYPITRLYDAMSDEHNAKFIALSRTAVPAMGEALKLAINLLGMAHCPNCDGSGFTSHQVSSKQYVTKDLEGTLYSDEEWEQEQCQWCDERSRIEAELEKIK